MSKGKWSEEKKKAWSEKCKAGANKRTLSKEGLERLRMSKKHHNSVYWTEEKRKEQSIRMKQKVQENPDSYSKSNVSGRAKLYEVFDSFGKTKVKGTWELKVANFLNKNQIKWTNNIEPFKYYWNNQWHLYFPDFHLVDSDVIIEVKGFETDRDRAKWKSVDKKLVIVRKNNMANLEECLKQAGGWQSH